ncbi:hypothetical protein RHSIM_Rhsim01G0105300 [Rhododendron simsii]|uniref:DNA-directed DNA polymerase family A palm domain-containing protein n=1 Tax=Rhododendron simsii TaxID=118357 RepID=A0A834HTP2_RHOSS|nr:hypothetical protein RHSIM_Rhsim01G0105300 [Rhododendron simsii]
MHGRGLWRTGVEDFVFKVREEKVKYAIASFQGSAADIIKIAMINMHSLIVGEVDDSDPATVAAKFHMLRGHCRILLQVHDKLVPEADPSVIKEAGWLLQMSMEKAASLLVPLRVKMKVGRPWRSLKPFLVEQNEQWSYSPKFLGSASLSLIYAESSPIFCSKKFVKLGKGLGKQHCLMDWNSLVLDGWSTCGFLLVHADAMIDKKLLQKYFMKHPHENLPVFADRVVL